MISPQSSNRQDLRVCVWGLTHTLICKPHTHSEMSAQDLRCVCMTVCVWWLYAHRMTVCVYDCMCVSGLAHTIMQWVRRNMSAWGLHCVCVWLCVREIHRLIKIIGLFAKYRSLLQVSFAGVWGLKWVRRICEVCVWLCVCDDCTHIAWRLVGSLKL